MPDPIPENQLKNIPGFKLEQHFREGLGEAIRYRSSLLEETGNRKSRVVETFQLMSSFRKAADAQLAKQNRIRLHHFKLTENQMMQQLLGDLSLHTTEKAFRDFQGRWFGKWDQMAVDHLWEPVRSSPFRAGIPPGRNPKIKALQYAWTGDGFGWNVGLKTQEKGITILGTVYHIEGHNPKKILYHMPHVGFVDGPNGLIWLAPGFFFFEEKIPGKFKSKDRYAITGSAFEMIGGQQQLKGDAFQAIYTRDPENRPAWHSFKLELEQSKGRTRSPSALPVR